MWNGGVSVTPRVPFLSRLQCECQHNTCGELCDRCCPGFNQKPWRAATVDSLNECQRKCRCTMAHSLRALTRRLLLAVRLAL